MTIEEFAKLVQDQLQARHREEYPDAESWSDPVTRVVHGKVYAKVDKGTANDKERGYGMCALFMVDIATGVIYGTKGYGRVDKRSRYGTLSTASDWDWAGKGYGPVYTENSPQATAWRKNCALRDT